MGNQIDEAFNWLILFLSVVSGALIELPDTAEVKKAVAVGLLSPLLVLVMVWLFSHLTDRVEAEVILKSYAWFFSSFMFLMFITIFGYVAYPEISDFLHQTSWLYLPLAIFFFVAPLVFYATAIQPKYRRIYKDSSFLRSRLKPALLYFVALLTYLAIQVYFIEYMGGIAALW